MLEMPRLSPKPRLPLPPGGLPVNPIRPDYDRYYTLDGAGHPVRGYDYTEHAMWQSCEGKAWQIKDILPEYAVDVWTYFSGWASLKDDKPHRRVLEKIRQTLPRKDAL